MSNRIGGADMTTDAKNRPGPKPGRPQSDVMTKALKRVLAGETAYRVARDMGIRHEYLCKRVKLERNKRAPV